MKTNPNLDFLRAFAITLVVVDHTFLAKGVTGWRGMRMEGVGLFGVYLFFVHTCLVLMWSLERRPHTLDFYIRRAFRIYPLAIVSVVAAVATRAPVSSANGHFFASVPFAWKTFIYNCLLVQNLRLHPNISGVLWSLAPEVDMYILLPCLFFYAVRTRALWPMLSLWLLSALMVNSLFPVAEGNNFAKLVPDFLAGVVAYVGFKSIAPRVPAWLFPPFLIGLFLMFMRPSHSRMDWVCCLLLGLALPYFKGLETRWVIRLSHELAKYSYGIYLFHPFCLAIGMYLLAYRTPAIQFGAYIGCLIPIVVIGYHLIEKPMIDLGAAVAGRIEDRYRTTTHDPI